MRDGNEAKGWTAEGLRANFQGDGNILYHDYNSIYITVYMSKLIKLFIKKVNCSRKLYLSRYMEQIR